MFGLFKNNNKDKPEKKGFEFPSRDYMESYREATEALFTSDKLREKMLADIRTCGIETACYGQAIQPDTIESLLSKFIEAGYDKPEVVIKGETMLDGSERWSATVDGKFVKVGCMFGTYSIDTTTLRETEERVITNLKRKLARTAKDETTITY